VDKANVTKNIPGHIMTCC